MRVVKTRSVNPWQQDTARSTYPPSLIFLHSDIDVSTCQACGGSMRIIAAILRTDVIHKILAARGLPADSPALRPAAQRTFDFTDAA